MDNAHPLVTLTTDFGLTDPYVGQLKGAMLRECPALTVVDLTHAIPAWDILAAAVVLRSSYTYFPQKTVHLIVVDPGVGGPRSILAGGGDGHFFVCPDNGILTLLLQEGKIERLHKVLPESRPHPVSPTFHGRDLMAPIAAQLAKRGEVLARLGPPVPLSQVQQIAWPHSESTDGTLRGRVLHVDRFGNIQSSIRIGPGRFDPATFSCLTIGDQRIDRWSTTYSDLPVGTLTILVDSVGFLEIAANQARAVDLLGCRPGDPLTVHCVHSPPSTSS